MESTVVVPRIQLATALKPCPFCGGAAAPRAADGWHGIGCLTSKCNGQRHALQFRSDEEAVRAWNTRSAVGKDCLSTAAKVGG